MNKEIVHKIGHFIKDGVIKLVKGVVLAYLLLLVFFSSMENKLVFNPAKQVTEYKYGFSPEFTHRDIELTSSDGTKLHGLHLRATQKTELDKNKIVLYCHGNAGNVFHRLHRMESFVRHGYQIFVFDYRGYGLSEGKAQEAGICQDAQAAYDFLRKEGWASDDIILHGTSLGGGVASYLAKNNDAHALVLEATFTSIPNMAGRLYPFLPKFIIRTKFSNEDRIQEIHLPTIILHGHLDELVPYEMGERLYTLSNASQKKIISFPRASHSNIMEIDEERYFQGYKWIENSSPSWPQRPNHNDKQLNSVVVKKQISND